LLRAAGVCQFLVGLAPVFERHLQLALQFGPGLLSGLIALALDDRDALLQNRDHGLKLLAPSLGGGQLLYRLDLTEPRVVQTQQRHGHRVDPAVGRQQRRKVLATRGSPVLQIFRGLLCGGQQAQALFQLT
jgi:hypothetical protein